MDIEVIESIYLKSNMYVIAENRHVIMVDPCENYQINDKVELDYIFLTHEHYDHISAVNYWKDRTNAKVVCSSVCGENIASPKKNLSKYFDAFRQMQTWIEDDGRVEVMPYECRVDTVFTKEMEIDWQNHQFIIFETPGHSQGSGCILLDHNWLFSGDTLMKDFPISCGLPGGSKKDWVSKSKVVLQSLSGDITVMPGHFGSFKLSDYKFWEVI